MTSFTVCEKTGLGATLGAALGLLAFGQAAQAANPLELNFWLSGPQYDGRLQTCEAALGDHHLAIPGKGKHLLEFALTITGYGRIHEIAFRPWQSDNIPRRYCSGDVMLSDGKRAHRALLDHRGWRLCRLRPGRRMVRDRA